MTCLSVPLQTLGDALQWECPDCSPAASGERDPAAASGKNVVAGGSEGSGDLIAAIRAIECDGSLTEQQKAKRRQELLSGATGSVSTEDGSPKKRRNGVREVLDILDGSLNCSVCMQLLERPVTVGFPAVYCFRKL